MAQRSPRRHDNQPGEPSVHPTSRRTPPLRGTAHERMGESPRSRMTTTIGSSSASSRATAHFGVTP
eukprot:312089-Prorocentrum_lima.AAC.1